MFYFINREDRNRIWNRGPWHFRKSMIVLEKPVGFGNISQLGFNKADFWIQIHDIPVFCMNRKMAKWLAEQIGHPIKECLDEEAKKRAIKGSPSKYGSWLKAPISDRAKPRLNTQVYESFSDRSRSNETSRETERNGSVSLKGESMVSQKDEQASTATVAQNLNKEDLQETLHPIADHGPIQANGMWMDGPSPGRIEPSIVMGLLEGEQS
ncbi:hypothetical protein Ddye_020911 [Dipteronia dyeriana]|uniref:DUF4283 domain-containing protein n=1 Tax=Dipteronia dyeriana TaxID=168575 RepID=A0AAD9U0N4_9ROSI|nr:hypothetical protein Ddye_020911 [Dipteronia dyeriana]